MNSLQNLAALGVIQGLTDGDTPFSPNDISGLLQWLKTVPSDGEVVDSKNTGTARDMQPGRAYLFDGVDDYIGFIRSSALSSFTASLYYKGSATGSNLRLFGATNTSQKIRTIGALAYNVTASGSGLYVDIKESEVSDDNWHHIVISAEQNGADVDCKIYLDGALKLDKTLLGLTLSHSSDNFAWGRFNSDYLSGKLHDCRLYSSAKTPSEIINNPLTDSVYWQKTDEGDGTTAYDSSGNGNHGAITNATLSTFHYEGSDVPYSYQNEVGYSESGGVLVPRNESIPTQDVLGNALSYSGSAPKNAKLINSSCAVFDGVDDYVDGINASKFNLGAADFEARMRLCLDGSGTGYRALFSSGYNAGSNGYSVYVNPSNKIEVWRTGLKLLTSNDLLPSDSWFQFKIKRIGSVLSVLVDDIEIGQDTYSGQLGDDTYNAYIARNTGGFYFKGKMCDFEIVSNGLLLPMAEGAGSVVYDVSGNGNHGTLTNITESVFWGSTQDDFHWNIEKGFSFSGSTRIPALEDGSADAAGNTITNPAVVVHNDAETQIDFTGGVEAPWKENVYLNDGTTKYTLPTAYSFGDAFSPSGQTCHFKEVISTKKENNFVLYDPGVSTADETTLTNNGYTN